MGAEREWIDVVQELSAIFCFAFPNLDRLTIFHSVTAKNASVSTLSLASQLATNPAMFGSHTL
jgi:hypothetical protein